MMQRIGNKQGSRRMLVMISILMALLVTACVAKNEDKNNWVAIEVMCMDKNMVLVDKLEIGGVELSACGIAERGNFTEREQRAIQKGLKESMENVSQVWYEDDLLTELNK